MNITVYCGSTMGKNPRFEETARELGTWIGANGHALVYGGSSVGLMGVLASAVLAAGGRVTGVEPRFFIEAGVAQLDVSELIEVQTMAERKAKMIELGDAFIALPGGVGTLEEISEVASQFRLRFHQAPCLFLNVDGFYEPMRTQLRAMLGEGFIDPREYEHLAFPETVAQVAQLLG